LNVKIGLVVIVSISKFSRKATVLEGDHATIIRKDDNFIGNRFSLIAGNY